MKKRNLILTISDYNNYGNRLQNYAVHKVLSSYGKAVTGECHPFKKKWKMILIRCMVFLPNNLIPVRLIPRNMRKKYLTARFNKNIPTTLQRFEKNASYYTKKANKVFYGSDQIWNPEFGPKNLIVPLTPKEKNIALCASFGVNHIPENMVEFYRGGLNSFALISVREEKGAEIVRELTGRDAEVLIDPTLNLNRKEWEKVERRPYGRMGRELERKCYILLYFLGELSDERKERIGRLAERLKAEVVDVLKDAISESTGPSEFIWLIHHACMVITDSYHGSIFSFLFDKAFYVLDREELTLELCMNSRFDTLFHKLMLYDRKNADIESFVEQHDYTESYRLLEEERKKYRDFVKKAMEL